MYDERHRQEYDTQYVIKCCSKHAKKIAKYEDEPGIHARNLETVVERNTVLWRQS